MAAKKNSLVANINRRKKRGTSRPKSKSTISSEAYAAMQADWPKSRARKSRTKKAPARAPTARRRQVARKARKR